MVESIPPSKPELCTLAHIQYMDNLIQDEMRTAKILMDRKAELLRRIDAATVQRQSGASGPPKRRALTTDIFTPFVVDPFRRNKTDVDSIRTFGAGAKRTTKVLGLLEKLRDVSKEHKDSVIRNGASCTMAETMAIHKALTRQHAKIRTFCEQEAGRVIGDRPEHTETSRRDESAKQFLEAVQRKREDASSSIQDGLEKRISRVSMVMGKRQKLQDELRLASDLQGFDTALREQRSALSAVGDNRGDIHRATQTLAQYASESGGYRQSGRALGRLCTTLEALMAETTLLTRRSACRGDHPRSLTRQQRDMFLDTLHSWEVHTVRAWKVAVHLRSQAGSALPSMTGNSTCLNSYSELKKELLAQTELLHSNFGVLRIADSTPFPELQPSHLSAFVDLTEKIRINLAKACLVPSEELAYVIGKHPVGTAIFPTVEVAAVGELNREEACIPLPRHDEQLENGTGSTPVDQAESAHPSTQGGGLQVEEEHKPFYATAVSIHDNTRLYSSDNPQEEQTEPKKSGDPQEASSTIGNAFWNMSDSNSHAPIFPSETSHQEVYIAPPLHGARVENSIDSTCANQAEYAHPIVFPVAEVAAVDELNREEACIPPPRHDEQLENVTGSTRVDQAEDAHPSAQSDVLKVEEKERVFYATDVNINTGAPNKAQEEHVKQQKKFEDSQEASSTVHSAFWNMSDSNSHASIPKVSLRDEQLENSTDSTYINQSQDASLCVPSETVEIKGGQNGIDSTKNTSTAHSSDNSQDKQAELPQKYKDSPEASNAVNTPFWNMSDSNSHGSIFQA